MPWLSSLTLCLSKIFLVIRLERLRDSSSGISLPTTVQMENSQQMRTLLTSQHSPLVLRHTCMLVTKIMSAQLTSQTELTPNFHLSREPIDINVLTICSLLIPRYRTADFTRTWSLLLAPKLLPHLLPLQLPLWLSSEHIESQGQQK